MIKELGLYAHFEAERARTFGAPSTTDYRFAFAYGEGVYVYDLDGYRWIDGHSGPGVFNLGYRHPTFRAVVREADDGPGSNEVVIKPWNDFLEALFDLLPKDWRWYGFPSNSGTEANEAAIKALIDTRPERNTFGVFQRAFHGRTGYSLCLTIRHPAHSRGYEKALERIIFPFPEHGSFWHYHPEKYIRHVENEILRHFDLRDMRAFFWEPVQGEGGIRVTSKPCFALFYDMLKSFDVALVSDEVQCGGGRTGKMFGFEHYDVTPDIVTMAKWIGNGIALGATAIRDIYTWKEERRHSGTMGGNPRASVAGCMVLKILQGEKLVERARESGTYLDRRLREEILKRFSSNWNWGRMLIDNLGGLGLMRRVRFVDLEDPEKPLTTLRDRVVEEAWKRGLLLMGAGDDAIRIMPPLVITDEQIDELVRILTEATYAAIQL